MKYRGDAVKMMSVPSVVQGETVRNFVDKCSTGEKMGNSVVAK